MSKPTASNTGKASTSAGELNLVSEAPSESLTKKETISKAQVLGQPDGPFGTAIASRSTVLLRSVGTARFSKFETVELAAHHPVDPAGVAKVDGEQHQHDAEHDGQRLVAGGAVPQGQAADRIKG